MRIDKNSEKKEFYKKHVINYKFPNKPKQILRC